MQTHPESVAPKSNRSWHLKVVMSSNPRVLGGKERRFQRFELVKCGMPSRTLGTCAAASVGQGAEEWGHILQLQITHGNHTNMSKLNKQQTKWDVKPVTYTIFYIQYIYIYECILLCTQLIQTLHRPPVAKRRQCPGCTSETWKTDHLAAGPHWALRTWHSLRWCPHPPGNGSIADWRERIWLMLA